MLENENTKGGVEIANLKSVLAKRGSQVSSLLAEVTRLTHDRDRLRNSLGELVKALETIYDEECTDFGTSAAYDRAVEVLGLSLNGK